MSVILLLLLLPLSIVMIFRRRRARRSRLVPWSLLITCIAGLGWWFVGLMRLFADVAAVDPARKATLMAVGITELANVIGFIFIVELPILFAAWLLDRRLNRMPPAILPPQ
jgi:hypothetical protein